MYQEIPSATSSGNVLEFLATGISQTTHRPRMLVPRTNIVFFLLMPEAVLVFDGDSQAQ